MGEKQNKSHPIPIEAKQNNAHTSSPQQKTKQKKTTKQNTTDG